MSRPCRITLCVLLGVVCSDAASRLSQYAAGRRSHQPPPLRTAEWSTHSQLGTITGAATAASIPTLTHSGLHDPIGSVSGLITRLLGAQVLPLFQLEIIPRDAASGNDVYEIDYNASTGNVIIRGNAGYALAAGLNWYLKYTCNASFSWGRHGSGNHVSLPATGPLPRPAPLRMASGVRFRYAYNVCTFGYSMAFWNFTSFEAELDRLALWGVNLPLAFQGQEYTAERFYRSIGLNETEITAYLAGPAFLPWQRMGNMQGWGGPLTRPWLDAQHALQLSIVTRMREFGMTPVLAGFAGHVPRAVALHFPNATYTNSPDWCGFQPQYGSDTLLEAIDPLFTQLGAGFNNMTLADYGDPTHLETPVFNADMFNEMDPNSAALDYLKESNAAVYQAMVAADSRAIYMMQAWLFHESFWTVARAQAFLSGVPVGSMIILDLNTEDGPVWKQLNNFWGHTWIWNSLITYGGRRGIYGDLDRLAAQPYADRAASPNMAGVGFTPEAIEMIPSQFDIAMEAGWRTTPPEPRAWLRAWAARRYGNSDTTRLPSPLLSAAQDVLAAAAFNSPIDTASLEGVPGVADSMSRNTNATGIFTALRMYYLAASTGQVGQAAIGTTFSYDITDLCRQFLINMFSDAHGLLGAVFARPPPSNASVPAYAAFASGIITDLDEVLAADQNFLLGTWIADAASWGTNTNETALWVYNARNQITLWGPRGEIRDYAAKNGWSGLVSTFYGGRWKILFDAMIASARTGTPMADIDAALLAFEQAWGLQTDDRPPTAASGEVPAELAGAAIDKYSTFHSSAWRPLADTDVALPPRGRDFIHIGVPGQAAVSSDCPFTDHGDGTSLAACEASCLAAPATRCNAINYSPGTPDCVLRTCADPLHPVLSPGYGDYSFYGLNQTASPLLYNAWHTDVGIVSTLCGSAAGAGACAGFNSEGKLFAATDKTVAAPGVTLWVRSA